MVTIALLLASELALSGQATVCEGPSPGQLSILPAGWSRVGTPFKNHIVQTGVVADLDGDGRVEIVTNYHHGLTGIFFNETDANGCRILRPIHARFDTKDQPVGDWPVKGIKAIDLNADGRYEIVTLADAVTYPYGGENRRERPALVTIVFNRDGSVGDPKPLVWGKWGERLCDWQAANVMVFDVPPSFHGGYPSYPGLLAKTWSRDERGTVFGRLFYLEPPEGSLLSVDYKQVQPGREGVPPYEEEPFYLKHIYLNTKPKPEEFKIYSSYGGGVEIGAVGADLNGTGIDDLVVAATLYDSSDRIRAGKVFRLLRRRDISLPNAYVFDLDLEQDFQAAFWSITQGRLDASAPPGQQALVVGLRPTAGPFSYAVGPAVLAPNASGRYDLVPISVPGATTYPYTDTYGMVALADLNGDGREDAIMTARYPQAEQKEPDLVVFYTQSSGRPFVYGAGTSQVLLRARSFSWGMHVFDTRQDGRLQLIAPSDTSDPYTGEFEKGWHWLYLWEIPQTQPGPRKPYFAAASVLNAASYEGGSVAAGEILAIFGAGIGPATPAGMQFTADGRHVTTTLAGTRVLFDGRPAPLIYVSDSQANCVVPLAVAGKRLVSVQVEHGGVLSEPIVLAVAQAVPGVFSTDSTGRGQGAILNWPDYSRNGPSNPAARGSAVMVFGTSGGSTEPPGEDGAIVTELQRLRSPVTAAVGGVPATVLYAGAAPQLIAGVLQVNLAVPENAPAGEAVPLVIAVAGVETQKRLTVAIRP